MTSIGETLRRERLRRGLQLEQIASETKIGLHLLQAMEADQFDRLPGGVFTRSFLRQYAHTLGVDEDEVIASLKEQFELPADPLPEPPPQRRTLHLPHLPPLGNVRERLRSDSSLAALVWVGIAIFGCAGVYSFWQRSKPTEPAAETRSVAPQRASHVAEPASLKPNVPAATTLEPSKPEFRPATVSDSGAITVPSAPPQEITNEPGAATDAARAMHVALIATEPVWVSIKSDGTRAYSGTIEGQESKQFHASRKMTVLVGNAGALQISLNGKPVGPIGSRGEIRLLVLTPGGAHIVPRMPPTSEDPTAPAGEGERP